MTAGFHREQHGMTRIDIDTGIPFEQFIAAFEKAAPPVDPTTLERIVKSGGAELAHELEARGYDWVSQELAPSSVA